MPETIDTQPIAVVRREVAECFGVHLTTIVRWSQEPDFPGRVGSRGRRDGCFPLRDIGVWLDRRFHKETP